MDSGGTIALPADNRARARDDCHRRVVRAGAGCRCRGRDDSWPRSRRGGRSCSAAPARNRRACARVAARGAGERPRRSAEADARRGRALRLNPRLSVAASDWDEPTVEVARATFVNHELDLIPDVADARSLGARAPARFDYIVTEPPYGMRLARRASLTALYVALLESFVGVKHRVFAAALGRTPFQVQRELELRGGKPPRRIYVLTPRSH